MESLASGKIEWAEVSLAKLMLLRLRMYLALMFCGRLSYFQVEQS